MCEPLMCFRGAQTTDHSGCVMTASIRDYYHTNTTFCAGASVRDPRIYTVAFCGVIGLRSPQILNCILYT